MLDGIKTSFSIKDLEELTGVSAHSIRIWERRYQLFDPQRTGGNIRRYTNEDLKKLLNIALLVKSGYKISDLASMSAQQLSATVYSSLTKKGDYEHAINELKVAMLHFDSHRFEDSYAKLISNLWQTNSISVAHEHYISNLLRQKLFFQIENLPAVPSSHKEQYILFLPLNELHELGLMFVHYVLRLHGHHSIYLGPQVDMLSLQGIPAKPTRIFIAYLTFAPPEEELTDFFKDMRSHVMYNDDQIWAVGNRIRGYRKHASWANVHLFPLLGEIITKIKT
jgi:DNA-binding transcriptional MerR regulator